MKRRELLKFGLCTGAARVFGPIGFASSAPPPVIDAHIHLFDPLRPGGIPWPEKADTVLYRPALPERYRKLASPLGVVGAIAVEASPLATDNDWLLDVAGKNPVIVGIIGDLVPGDRTYTKALDRLRANPLFLGLRYGNLWGRNLAEDTNKPGFLEGLKALRQAGLVFEAANPDAQLLRALLKVCDALPGLTIVVDHLPHATVPVDASARKQYDATLRRLAENPRIFVKLSEVPVLVNGKLVTDALFYRDNLDAIWEVFGEDHLLFGSDWPNSDHLATYAETFSIVRQYLFHKSASASAKFFWKNSIAAYQWRRRDPTQPSL